MNKGVKNNKNKLKTGPTVHNTNLYYKAAVIKSAWQTHKKDMDQWNRIEFRNVPTLILAIN